jgi:hypothetical protein
MLKSFALALALVVAFALPHGAFAQGNGVKDVQQRLASLETTVASLQQAVSALQTENAAQSTLLQSQASAIEALQSALTKQIADSKAYTDSMGTSTLASAKTYTDGKVAPLADKLTHFSRNGNEVYITGANLNIRNGLGHSYASLNGLGNLVVGYNELRTGTDAVNTRTGSHNLVIGLQNNFSSAGAIVAGSNNNSTNYMASVYGGTGNTASGLYAHISGGYNNTASGNWSNIGGGRDKVASSTLANLP